jgi:hypothetical protein
VCLGDDVIAEDPPSQNKHGNQGKDVNRGEVNVRSVSTMLLCKAVIKLFDLV